MRLEKPTCMSNHLKPLLRFFRSHGKTRRSPFVFIPFRVLHQNDEKENVITLYKHIHTRVSLLSVVFCALTDRQQGTQTSDFSPLTLHLMGGQCLHGNSTIIPLNEDIHWTWPALNFVKHLQEALVFN